MAGKGNIRKLGARWGGRQPDFSVAVATGAAANTNIAVAGLKTNDLLIAVIEVPASTTTMVDRTAVSSITSAGNIQSTVTTAGNQVLVFYWSV
jgi:hypothetical protein